MKASSVGLVAFGAAYLATLAALFVIERANEIRGPA